MTLIVNLNSLDHIYDYLSIGVDHFIVGAEVFSLRQAKSFSYEEIRQLKQSDSQIKVFVLVNALVEQHLLPELKTHLKTLAKLQVDGILFQDFGVLQICKNEHYPFLKKKLISDHLEMKTMVQIHGVEYMAYSKRKLLSNYKSFTHLEFNCDKSQDIQIQANGVDSRCHIYEDDYGTHVLSCQQLCALDVLNQFDSFDYLMIDGQYTEPTILLEIVNLYAQGIEFNSKGKYAKESIELMHLLYRLTPGISYYHSFLFDSTVYKIDDVRIGKDE